MVKTLALILVISVLVFFQNEKAEAWSISKAYKSAVHHVEKGAKSTVQHVEKGAHSASEYVQDGTKSSFRYVERSVRKNPEIYGAVVGGAIGGPALGGVLGGTLAGTVAGAGAGAYAGKVYKRKHSDSGGSSSLAGAALRNGTSTASQGYGSATFSIVFPDPATLPKDSAAYRAYQSAQSAAVKQTETKTGTGSATITW